MELVTVLDELTTKMSDIIKKHKEQAISREALSQITYSQFILIHAIDASKKATVTELANVLSVTKPTLTAAVKNLIKLGLVERTPSETDKRVFYLSLTEKGESIGRAEREAFGECIENMKTKLGDDFPQFEQMLRRILED